MTPPRPASGELPHCYQCGGIGFRVTGRETPDPSWFWRLLRIRATTVPVEHCSCRATKGEIK